MRKNEESLQAPQEDSEEQRHPRRNMMSSTMFTSTATVTRVEHASLQQVDITGVMLTAKPAAHVHSAATATPLAPPAVPGHVIAESLASENWTRTEDSIRNDDLHHSHSHMHMFSVLDLPMSAIQTLDPILNVNQRLPRAKLLQNSNTGSSVPIWNITGQLVDFNYSLAVYFTKGSWARTLWEQLGSPVDRWLQIL
jgi:hypothetical protein